MRPPRSSGAVSSPDGGLATVGITGGEGAGQLRARAVEKRPAATRRPGAGPVCRFPISCTGAALLQPPPVQKHHPARVGFLPEGPPAQPLPVGRFQGPAADDWLSREGGVGPPGEPARLALLSPVGICASIVPAPHVRATLGPVLPEQDLQGNSWLLGGP